MYTYAVNNPLAFVDPDGRDVIAVNFQRMVLNNGHEGTIVVQKTGAATYQRFGPRENAPLGGGKIETTTLRTTVQFSPDGLPTDSSYKALATEVAGIEHNQDPNSVRMNYFKTSDADTQMLVAMLKRLQAASDRGQAPYYDVGKQNCAAHTISCLIQAHAIAENAHISLVPNRLFDLLSLLADESYANQQRTKRRVKAKKFYDVDYEIIYDLPE
jgi:hypothetical protein